jgi:hypothetical protein
MHSATRQSLHRKDITEPPFLPGDERIDDRGVVDEPVVSSPKETGASQKTPKRKGKPQGNKGVCGYHCSNRKMGFPPEMVQDRFLDFILSLARRGRDKPTAFRRSLLSAGEAPRVEP